MATIAIIADNEFGDAALADPMSRLRAAGHVLVVLGRHPGDSLVGRDGAVSFLVDDAIGDRRPEEFDALLLGGGYATDTLRTFGPAVHFVREFCKTGRPVGAISHGAQLLIETGMMDGMNMTSDLSDKPDLLKAGAKWSDQSLVEHSYLITSSGAQDLPAFGHALVRALEIAPPPVSRWT